MMLSFRPRSSRFWWHVLPEEKSIKIAWIYVGNAWIAGKGKLARLEGREWRNEEVNEA
jgi:hypothetical protein